MSEATDGRLVYYDANIWVAYMQGSVDKYYHTAKTLIDDVEDGKRIAIVPHLVILETVFVIRKRQAYRAIKKGKATDRDATPLLKPIITEYLDRINRLAEEGKIIIPEYADKVYDHHRAVLQKCTVYHGFFVSEECPACRIPREARDGAFTCPSCGLAAKSGELDYRVLGPADMEHAYLARRSAAEAFYTSDKTFRCLASDPDFAPMRFEIIRPAPSGG